MTSVWFGLTLTNLAGVFEVFISSCTCAVGPKVADRQSEADELLKSDAANPDRALFNSDVRSSPLHVQLTSS